MRKRHPHPFVKTVIHFGAKIVVGLRYNEFLGKDFFEVERLGGNSLGSWNVVDLGILGFEEVWIVVELV